MLRGRHFFNISLSKENHEQSASMGEVCSRKSWTETFFHRLDALQDSNSNYPPYNIVRVDSDSQVLEIALAGFKREEIEVSTERNVLTVSVRSEHEDREFVHKGLAKRSFARNWQLSDDTVVGDVKFEDGLLTIVLRKELPEAQRRRVLDIL